MSDAGQSGAELRQLLYQLGNDFLSRLNSQSPIDFKQIDQINQHPLMKLIHKLDPDFSILTSDEYYDVDADAVPTAWKLGPISDAIVNKLVEEPPNPFDNVFYAELFKESRINKMVSTLSDKNAPLEGLAFNLIDLYLLAEDARGSSPILVAYIVFALSAQIAQSQGEVREVGLTLGLDRLKALGKRMRHYSQYKHVDQKINVIQFLVKNMADRSLYCQLYTQNLQPSVETRIELALEMLRGNAPVFEMKRWMKPSDDYNYFADPRSIASVLLGHPQTVELIQFLEPMLDRYENGLWIDELLFEGY